MTEKYLIVKLDQYAGNVDEIVSVALTGNGRGNGRVGYEQAKKVYAEYVEPLLKQSKLPVSFRDFYTEYGESMYDLDVSSCNNLRFCIDPKTTDKMLRELIKLWFDAYSNFDGILQIPLDDIDDESCVVEILEFELVTKTETRTKL